ncbi:hypothetical protein ACRARG_17745 [Pseudooceanicola sp. C21-150M6]|uniref:hypothetical protein n=1 Tax=Pseudooceanicola sp. C21-150M6 TaxID=3434355 RepID=UPI003D7F4F39
MPDTAPLGSVLRTCLAGTFVVASLLADPVSAQGKNLTLVGIPSGTTAPAGLFFLSGSYATRRAPTASDGDGSIALGFGLGDADRNIGFQVTGQITSLTDDFGDSGYFELKASRRIDTGSAPTYFGLAVGNLAPWGDAKIHDTSVTAAITTFTQLDMGADSFPIALTVGGGSHIRNFNTDPGVFVGAGIGLTDYFGASLAWTGESVTIGTAFRPGRSPFQISLSAEDVFDQIDNRRAVLSISYVFDAKVRR